MQGVASFYISANQCYFFDVIYICVAIDMIEILKMKIISINIMASGDIEEASASCESRWRH